MTTSVDGWFKNAIASDGEGLDNIAEYVYNSRPDAEVMPHVVEVLGVG